MKICLDIPKLFCTQRQTRQSNYKKEVLHSDADAPQTNRTALTTSSQQVGKSNMKTIQKQNNS